MRCLQGGVAGNRRTYRSQRRAIQRDHSRQQGACSDGLLGFMVRAVPDGGTSRGATARDMAGRAVVVKVDTERFPSLAAQYNVRSIPNFAVFSRGQLQFQQAGLVDAATMESWLTRAA